MGQRFLPRPIARYDQSLLPVLNENFSQLSRLLASIPTESIGPTAPTNPYSGQMWVDTNTWTIRVWDGAAWQPGQWTNFTPILVQSVAISKNITYCRYEKRGRTTTYQGYILPISNGTAGNIIAISIPFTAAQNAIPVGYFYWYSSALGKNFIMPAGLQTTSAIYALIPNTGFALGTLATDGVYTFPTQVISGDAFLWAITYEAAS